MKELIPYSRQNITKEDIKSVTNVLNSDFISRGPECKKFEHKINKYVGSNYCIATNSATSALYMACKALNLKPKEIVWTSSISFAASANCAALCGAKVDFVDIDLNNYNLSIDKLENKLKIAKKKNKLPKIIIPVHYAGFPCDMERIYKLKKKYHFFIIEDASHAIGSSYNNIKIGSNKHSDMTVFSFQAVKVITTGEGGAVTTNNKKIFEKLILLRAHGINKNKLSFKNRKNSIFPWYYEQINLSFNFILPDINAALGLSQLRKIDYNILKRNELIEYYKKKLLNSKIKLLEIPKNINSSHHLLPALYEFKNLRHKANFFNFMKKNKILLQVLYIPIYKHPYYQNRKINYSEFYNSEFFYKNVFSLPLHLKLTKKNIDYICSKLMEWLNS
jgi:UDP-4-amino-4,6-dideoxy-N-acetyl-beta-L-altrosamine transaminase